MSAALGVGGVGFLRFKVGRMLAAADTFQVCYAALAARAASEDLYTWKLRPKFHYFWHMVKFGAETSLNPERLACWHEESYLGRVKRLAVMCTGREHVDDLHA